MSLVRYEPWRGAGQLQDEINRLFSSWSTNESSSVIADWMPNVDIFELDDSFRLQVDIPGVDPQTVDITLDNGVLTIAGERKFEKPEGENLSHRRSERAHGRFHRRFVLPDTVDADNVKARDQHGVLEISIPKLAKAAPRRIKVAA